MSPSPALHTSQLRVENPVQRKTKHGKGKAGEHQEKGRLQHPVVLSLKKRTVL